ncbi:guided entry of tail-anchored proteins factor CAMLG [Brachyhypopomus gauderio]|uniref:guided entry of tail-anchored proteins factor CAMLG n=1 Tax=Brachyhypopomus gauderio TaxID=698409 RepID=UPI004043890B
METSDDVGQNGHEEKTSRTAAQKRAEIRRRKLLMNSEDRMNKIVGYSKSDGENSESRRVMEPRFHLDLDGTETWSPPVSSRRLSPYVGEVGGSSTTPCETPERRGSPLLGSRAGLDEEDVVARASWQRPGGEPGADLHSRSPRRGLQKYLSRFDDAMKLRGQLASEKAAQDGGGDGEELDSFRLFRLTGSALLAVFVRVFVCQYLSIFAPFLTLQLAYMGLYKYFPKVEKKMKTTVLTAALLLSGIPAEVINHSMDTYRKMGDVFSDLCVYFFTFITCHELMLLFSSETT